MKRIKITLLVAFSVASLNFQSSASANSTSEALLERGVALLIGKRDGRQIQLTLEKDLSYHTDTGVRGRWSMDGDEICLVRDADSNVDGRGGLQSCGFLPDGKVVGDQWIDLSVGGDGEKFSIIRTAKE